MRSRTSHRHARAVLIAGCICALALAAAAAASEKHEAVLGPWSRVHGMLVVQGRIDRANTALFGLYCEPNILHSGRYARACRRIPSTPRLFVGYGLFAPPATIERTWAASKWEMWIDGERVDLAAFGTSDRTLFSYQGAGGKDVTLREWSVTLVGAKPGRHTIRYRIRDQSGTIDATWTFTVVRPQGG